MTYNYSPALQRHYASAPEGEFLAQCIVLSHSGFKEGVYYLTNVPQAFSAAFEGVSVDWEPVPFSAIKPNRVVNAMQNMQITLDNISPVITEELERAIKQNIEPILFKYTEYLIDEDGQPKAGAEIDPAIEMNVNYFECTLDTVVFSATHEDVVNRAFPFELFRLDNFPGLR